MAEFPNMPLWTDAIMADCYHLTPAEFGAYMRLLICAWRSPGCRLPNDDVRLGRMIGDPKIWKRIKPAVMPFFDTDEKGNLIQKRLLKERDWCATKRQKQSMAGKVSALKRKEARSTDVQQMNQQNANPYTHTLSSNISKEDMLRVNSNGVHAPERYPIKEAFDHFNMAAGELGLPMATKLTEARKRHLRARLKEYSLDQFDQMLLEIEKSSFLRGEGNKAWRPNLDWICKPDNFAKVLEGAYRDE